jgi:acylphosphatase
LTRKRVLVSGRVQGVFFRDTARRRAEAAGVSGWIRNTPDGSVEAVFEGDPSAVEALLAWVRRGPVRARVDGTAVTEEEPTGEVGFHIR